MPGSTNKAGVRDGLTAVPARRIPLIRCILPRDAEMTVGADTRIRRAGVAILGLIVSLVSLFLVARSVNLGEVGRIVAGASPGLIALAVGVMSLALGLRVVTCFVLLADRADGSRVGIRRLTSPVLVGYLGNLVLPARLGEVVRSYLISRREALPIGATLGSVALERILDTAMLAAIAFVAASLLGAAPWIVQGTGLVAIVGVILVTALATTGLQPLVRLLGRLGLLRAPITAVLKVIEPFAYWSGGGHRRIAIGLGLALSLAAWLCNAAMFWLVGRALGTSLSPAVALLVMAVTVLATAIPSAPGYVGTFELAAVAVASSLGIPRDTALALAVLAHVIALVPALAGGSLALMRLGGGLGELSAAAVEHGRTGSSPVIGAPTE
jgi:glycosyltransferase 2 family protein